MADAFDKKEDIDDNNRRILRLVRAKYERLCDLIEAAVPMGVGKKLYTNKIISSEAHRSLDTQGISKSQQASKLMDAVTLTLRADDTDETFMEFLEVLRSVSGPCKRLADNLYTEYTKKQPPPLPVPKPNDNGANFSDSSSVVIIDKPFNLGVVMEELSKLDFPMAKWRDLGLFLDITHPVLQAIAMDLGYGNQKHCLIEMLSSWLHQAVTPSWEGLAAGLRKIKFETIAIEVEKKQGILSDRNLKEIIELLAEHDFDDSYWQMLGLMLGVSNPILQAIDANHGGGRSNAQTRALMDTLNRWIHQDPQASWGKLIAAIEKCGLNSIVTKLREL